MKFDAELSELNENLETNITIPHSSDDSGPQAILKYGTMPPTPACSSPPSKQAKVLSMDTLKKLNAGGLIPPPVPSLFVGPSIEEALEQSLYNPNQTTNVYIRGLPPDTTDETLLAICERFGTISSSKAIVDIQTGLCKGFGFAFYNNEDDATACIAGLTHCGYQVSFAKESFSTRLKNLQDPQSTNLYLSNLPLHMHEKDLEDLFQPYKVVSNRILRDSNNMSRGVGFARLADRNSAEAVIDKFDNTCLAGSPDDLPLQVRFADSPNQKRLKGQTQRRRQWRAREYNLLTGHLGLEDLSPTIPGSDISQNCIFAPSSDTSYEHSQYNEDYLSACYRADYSCQAYAQAQFVPHANLEDGAHRLQPAEAIETSMARKLTI
ncbi:Sporulation-specific protein 5 [Taphrina deformans PYCC 5710]|uniref:Sporulation-specific protein 5 n=1 Tax=Taphrina deformans (strain PYCC 5710 / ATCC 11124 / CBS 356.35 / IMI 108563 / JCM 9778 / NBRC 8474) TaxID=1097556 RepID=R4XD42_TAPDE|nr:Sporulation-specific protein 5 [Taphrina deformans PYCC 5710]|eukprot:CCG81240.2 Sporulation-specific protein 5 [Taphrina deformans PYCC 5710]